MGRWSGHEHGTAIIEFVLLGVVLLVPLMYLVLAVSTVQRNLYGVTHAAREAGRAYTTGTAATAVQRAEYAARLALEDQGVSGEDIHLRYGPAGADCGSASTEPWPLTPGAEFALCVTRQITVPGVPGFLVGRNNTITGRYVVHADDYRDYRADSHQRGWRVSVRPRSVGRLQPSSPARRPAGHQ